MSGVTRLHQHYHAHGRPGYFRLTICWAEDGRQREMQITGPNAAAVHQRLLHCPDDEHRVLILDAVIDGGIDATLSAG